MALVLTLGAAVTSTSALLFPGLATAAAPAPYPGPQQAARVVLIAVPDLGWDDLAQMPNLERYAATSAVGNVAVRAEPSASRCADGSLTIAAGNRADAGGTTGCTVPIADYPSLRNRLRADRFGSDIATLGQTLFAHNDVAASVGSGANLLLGNATGHVPLVADTLDAAVNRAAVVAVLDDDLYLAPTAQRPDARHRLDTEIAAQIGLVPPAATVIVTASSDGRSGGPHLRPMIVHGPGWPHRELTSASTHSRFVQLVDIAPTVLSRLALPVPDGMIGSIIHPSEQAVAAPASYLDVDRHAQAARRYDGNVRSVFGALGILVLGLLVLAGWRRDDKSRRGAVAVSRIAVALPAVTYLLQPAHWWRWDAFEYVAVVAAVSLLVAGLMTVLVRKSPTVGLLALAFVTVAVLALDQFLGAPLQTSAPLGNLPLVAGRFHGMGNIAFALFCSAALLVAGVTGGWLANRSRPKLGVVVAAAIGLIALVIDAAPSLGDDFGGLLAMVPCILLLVALLAGVRVTASRVVAVVVGVIAVATGLAAVDYSRPASKRTHIGNFAGEVLHGGAGRTIWRKLDSDVHSFGNVAVTGSVALLIILMIVERQRLQQILGTVPGLTAAAWSIGALAALGTAVNDSGVVIAQFILLPAVFAVVGVGLAEVSDLAGRRPPLPPPLGAPPASYRG